MRIAVIGMIPFLILGFIVVHLIKMMRLYLVLLEQKIEFKRFVFAYFQTTLVNLIIPFKLGEVYRIFTFSRMTKSVQIGLFSVIVDRFFDTMALVLILLPFQMLITGHLTLSAVFLTVFVIIILFIFWVFPSVYGYLNKYIIINRSSRRSLAVLKTLELLKMGYEYVRHLVSGRYALLLLLSFGAWIMESIVLFGVSKLYDLPFTTDTFSEYISSILSANHNILMQIYTFLSIVMIAAFTIIAFICMSVKKNTQSDKRRMESKS